MIFYPIINYIIEHISYHRCLVSHKLCQILLEFLEINFIRTPFMHMVITHILGNLYLHIIYLDFFLSPSPLFNPLCPYLELFPFFPFILFLPFPLPSFPLPSSLFSFPFEHFLFTFHYLSSILVIIYALGFILFSFLVSSN